MSTENLQKFYALINQRPDLRSQLDKLPDSGSFVQHMVQLGAENGYVFTAKELEAAIATKIPDLDLLSDDQLEMVAGAARSSTRQLGSGPESGTSCADSRWIDPFCTP